MSVLLVQLSELALEVSQIGQIYLILNFCKFVEQVWQ